LIKKIGITSLAALAVSYICLGQQATPEIHLNQVGFYTDAPKLAAVTRSTGSNKFFVINTISADTVFKGELGVEKISSNSGTKTRIADFSGVQRDGVYRLDVTGLGQSYQFKIGKGIHAQTAKALLKGFYYQRSDVPLHKPHAGQWARAAGHPDTAVIIHPSAASAERPAGMVISSPGGWYDAGDYNKYVVNSGITMGTLLSAYEDFVPYYNRLQTNIPESDNAVPDILDEVIYNLRWMLTMQDSIDGGVYHKCTNAAFDGMVMPGVTKAPRYVVQKGTAAALDFAAVCAQAARVLAPFKKQLARLSDSCLTAATKAWNWAEKNPHVEYNQTEINKKFLPQISTGAYGYNNFNDEWMWAAAELLVTTRDRKYFAVIEKGAGDKSILPSWANVGMLATYTLLRHNKSLPAYVQAVVKTKRAGMVAMADALVAGIKRSAFGTAMGGAKSDFVWGSSAVAANQAILLLNAYLQTGENKYLDGAISNADYLLGRNATGYCFVTGIGSRSPMNPHHRPSIADTLKEPVPGFLSGGPNPGRQDSCTYEFFEPETAFVDSDCSYASNEIAINWNAPAVYLFNALEALKEKKAVEKSR
jgi:endoglucanase